MTFSLYLHSGILIKEEDVTFVLLKNSYGEFGILDNHLPIVLTCVDGYIKIEKGPTERLFIVLKEAVMKFENHTASVMASAASFGETLAEAKTRFEIESKDILDNERKLNADFSILENKLKDSVKKIHAGELGSNV